MSTRILAILQNQWVKNPERVRAAIAASKDPVAYRRRFNAYALFAGCMTGRRLRKEFGDLCDTIVWEEASPEIGGHAASSFPADLDHIRASIADVKPRIVIGFGKIASDALNIIGPSLDLPDVFMIHCQHPTARGASSLPSLANAASLLRDLLASKHLTPALS